MKAKACVHKNLFPHVHVGSDAPEPETKWEKENGGKVHWRCWNGLMQRNTITVNYNGRTGTHEKIARIIADALKGAAEEVEL